MKKLPHILLSIALGCLWSCSNSDEPEVTTPAKPIELTAAEAASRSACSSFGMDFFATELAKHAENENIVLSPFSAATALAFYANAAGDELSQQIQTLLGSADIDALNSYTAKMAAQLPTLDNRTDLAIANAVWYNNLYTVNPGFASIAEEIYKSPCTAVNFADAVAAQNLIDQWVNKQTRGMIPDFKLPLGQATLSILANALYFKGEWTETFDKAKTTDLIFRGAVRDVSAPMMRDDRGAGFYCIPELTAVTLPFGNKAFQMHFVLPSEDYTPLSLLKDGKLTAEILFDPRHAAVDLTIPRFAIPAGNQIDITKTLSEMGLSAIERAGEFKLFTEAVNEAATKVFQKAAIEVNEEGAKAAAVTVVEGYTAAWDIPVTFDRPFLFFITEKSTQTILFAGRVAQL